MRRLKELGPKYCKVYCYMAVFFKDFLHQGFISTDFEKGKNRTQDIFVCSSLNDAHEPRLLVLAMCCGSGKVDRFKGRKVVERAPLGLELPQKYGALFDYTL